MWDPGVLHWQGSSGFPWHIWAAICRNDFQWKKQSLGLCAFSLWLGYFCIMPIHVRSCCVVSWLLPHSQQIASNNNYPESNSTWNSHCSSAGASQVRQWWASCNIRENSWRQCSDEMSQRGSVAALVSWSQGDQGDKEIILGGLLEK